MPVSSSSPSRKPQRIELYFRDYRAGQTLRTNLLTSLGDDLAI